MDICYVVALIDVLDYVFAKCQFAKTFDVICESKKEDCVACVCECRAEGQGIRFGFSSGGV